jgi:membrane-associated protease RseP (regulator of RpoE activity)
MGLLGSTHYVDQPAFPLAATRAMVNIDMIGRGPAREILVSGVGTAAGLRRVVEEEAALQRVSPVMSEGGYGPSDHTPFYARQVPVLFFFTPPHEDYHRPTDRPEKVDFYAIEARARLIFGVVSRLAAGEVDLEFVRADGGEPPGARHGGEGYGGRSYGPYLGTVPDFVPGGEGLRLTGVREGSPAAQAGLLGGDVIVGWNGRPILDLEDYAAALRAQRPGDRVTIAFRRGAAEDTTLAILARRPAGQP